MTSSEPSISQILLVSNFEQSLNFYDTLLSEIGVKRIKTIREDRKQAVYGINEDLIFLSILESPNYSSEFALNSGKTLFPAKTHSDVDTFYRTAIANGATEIQKPGLREDKSYSTSVKDVDGHHIGAFNTTEE